MGWLITCLFIVGETAGGGLIAMPTAVISTGRSHLFLHFQHALDSRRVIELSSFSGEVSTRSACIEQRLTSK